MMDEIRCLLEEMAGCGNTFMGRGRKAKIQSAIWSHDGRKG